MIGKAGYSLQSLYTEYLFLPIFSSPLVECALPHIAFPDKKVHGANMGPTWVLLAPNGPPVGPTNLAISVDYTSAVESLAEDAMTMLQVDKLTYSGQQISDNY